jgi:hypothetical protein
MKLKDRFIEHVYCFMGSGMLTNTYDEQIANWNAERCENIAHDFATEFAEWCGVPIADLDIEELLKEYKKIKGL